MAIYQVNEAGEAEYNFTYLDRVMDSYVELGLRPFLELGFMPDKLASGSIGRGMLLRRLPMRGGAI